MKILELPAYFLPNKGGIEYSVYYLSKEFVKTGEEVAVVSSDLNSNKNEESLDGINVKRIKSFSFLRVPVSFKLKKALMKEDFDIIHLHYPHPFFLDIGAGVAMKKKKPYVVHCHGKEIELKGLVGFFGRIYNKLFFDKVLKNAARIITNTSKVVSQSKHLTKYKEKIVTIPHGVDTGMFKKADTNLKHKLGLEKNKIILYAGALRWYKGLDCLIKAFAEILKQVPETRLMIIGKGEEERKIKKLAENLGADDKIFFQGFVETDELIEYYSIADLFILPSPTIEESFGMVAMEAAAIGVPTIVTEGAGVSELFDAEGFGVIVKPNDSKDIAKAAVEILTNERKSKALSEIGAKVIKDKYTWEQIAKKYLKMFNEVLNQNE